MPVFDHYNDPFSIEGLLSLPVLATEPCSVWQPLDLDDRHFDGAFKLIEPKPEVLLDLRSDYFHLDISDVPLPGTESPLESTLSSDVDEPPTADITVERNDPRHDVDIWVLPDVIRPQIQSALTSWDDFLSSSHAEPKIAYLSEAGPIAFDTVLTRASAKDGRVVPSKIALPDGFVSALFELGLGRSSELFEWNDSRRAFTPIGEEFGLLGISTDIQTATIKSFIDIGNTTKALQDFIQGSTGPSSSNPVLIALSSGVSQALHATLQILAKDRVGVRTILQLQEHFERPRILVGCLQQIVKTAQSGSNEDEIITNITTETAQLVSKVPWLEDLLYNIVTRAASPLIRNISTSVGLGSTHTRFPFSDAGGKSLVNTIGDPPYGILPSDLSEVIMESQISLELIRTDRPDHPVLSSRPGAPSRPYLSWECSGEAIVELQKRANEYERSLREAVLEFAQGLPDNDQNTKHPDAETKSPNVTVGLQDGDSHLLDLPLIPIRGQHLGMEQAADDAKLDNIVSSSLCPDESSSFTLTPRLTETLALSLAPLVTAQNRLLSSSVLHLLFKSHDFRSHLNLQSRFQLLSDGMFASRLGQALFDPDLSSSEGRRKGEGKTGLRLQSRDTWPPASSELRLVLMGVLAESFASGDATAKKHRLSDSIMSESISFSIRDLSDDELEKCRDASSVYALDFLRLQYKPSSTLLDAVLTPSSLKKYDRVFKHLLRILRMKSVALILVRDVAGRNSRQGRRKDQRFRLEINHFVSTLADYSANVAVGVAWARLQALVEKVDKCLDRSDFDGAINLAGGIVRLREIHERTLDSMIRALCIDRKQVQVKTLLDDLFGLILRFAATTRKDIMTDDDDDNVKSMFVEFRKQVGRFIRYLRTQSDASSSTLTPFGGAGYAEVLPFEHLLLRLDLYGYYN